MAFNHIDTMNKNGILFTVQVGGVHYVIPADAINVKAIMSELGASDAKKVTFSIAINTKIDTAAVKNAVTGGDGELVIPAVSFTAKAEYDGKTVDIDKFDKYVSRVVELTEEQAAKVTTAVVVSSAGSLRHVPTRVYKQGRKWYAEINSLTDSTYAVINREKTFSDIKGKWYEESAKEIASRRIVTSREDIFNGEASISRGEFVALIIRALGIPELGGDASMYTDLKRGSLYYGAIGRAYEYGIVNGRGDGIFDANANITWQEAMLMLKRAAVAAGYKGSIGSLDKYADAGDIADWAVEAAQFCVGSRLLAGNNDGAHLNPLTHITRAEAADIVLRLLRRALLI